MIDFLLYHGHGASNDSYPHDTIPDGSIWFPHHFWTGIFLALFLIYADKREGQPVGAIAGILVAVYGWLFLWQSGLSPFWGSVFSVAGIGFATLTVLIGPYWRRGSHGLLSWSCLLRLFVLVALLVALDDVIQHSVGWATPIDSWWNNRGHELTEIYS